MHKKWFRKLFFTRLIIVILILSQIIVLLNFVLSKSQSSRIFSLVLTSASIITVFYVLSRKVKSSYKITWVIIILTFPLFGGLMYLLVHFQSSTKRFNAIDRVSKKAKKLFYLPGSAYKESLEEMPQFTCQIKYLQNYANFPIYSNTSVHYLSPGESKLKSMLEQLEKAEKYIFLEYYIVKEGAMWNSVLDILIRKVKQGVVVRLLYDDMGCFFTLPQDYPEQLRKYGIECTVFNPFRPVMTAQQNNRNHRKIAVIDGKVAFTGGINLSDEYINAVERFGHWKDASIMVKGLAAWSFTLMFLQMWDLCTNSDEDYYSYYPWKNEICQIDSGGFVQPYADNPVDSDYIGEHVYMQIINNARDYIYINTPYLIVDDSMFSALCLAAKSGVDVRIVTPHKWDKWLVHVTTRSYYQDLISAGVKIYEYTEGFMHSKTFVSDDIVATVGTINMDFRSLYLNFECGALLYENSAIMGIKDDFIKTLDKCVAITTDNCKTNIFMGMFQDLLRLVAPLM